MPQPMSFKDRFAHIRSDYNEGEQSLDDHIQVIIEGTDAFLKFAKIRARTRDGGESVDKEFSAITLLCPAAGSGCDECYASTKFLEKMAPNVWEFVENEAPEGEPPQACVCAALRTLTEKDTEDLEKLAKLHGLIVYAYESK